MLQSTDIFAVLVTYQVDYPACSSWKSLHQAITATQMHWLVYDNSPVASISPTPTYLQYQHHPENPGVSAAYIEAARLAEKKGCKWLLLLDQDSIFPANWFESYASCVADHPSAKILTPIMRTENLLISPSKMRFGRGWPAKEIPSSPYDLHQYAPINAGCLVDVAAYLQSGGHRTAVALDFSDFAFVHHFQKIYPQAYLVNLNIEHRLSGVERSPYKAAFERFKHYCRGALAFGNQGGPKIWLLFWCIWRALLLSLRYQNVNFFNVFWSEFKKW